MTYLKSGHLEPAQGLLKNALKQDPNLPPAEQGW